MENVGYLQYVRSEREGRVDEGDFLVRFASLGTGLTSPRHIKTNKRNRFEAEKV